MTKIEHLQFLVLLIPTFLILAAAAVSMADLAFPAGAETYAVAAAPERQAPVDVIREDRQGE
jgi:hypothetical protein